MTIQAQTPDGAIHEFPDGTPDNVIDGAIRDYLYQPSVVSDVGHAAASGVGNLANLYTNPTGYFKENVMSPIVSGATRLAGEAYTHLGGDLTPEQAEFLTNPLPPSDYDKAMKAVTGAVTKRYGADPNYQPATAQGRAVKTGVSSAPFAVSDGVAPTIARMAGMGTGSEAGREIAQDLGATPEQQEAASVVGGMAGYGASEAGPFFRDTFNPVRGEGTPKVAPFLQQKARNIDYVEGVNANAANMQRTYDAGYNKAREISRGITRNEPQLQQSATKLLDYLNDDPAHNGTQGTSQAYEDLNSVVNSFDDKGNIPLDSITLLQRRVNDLYSPDMSDTRKAIYDTLNSQLKKATARASGDNPEWGAMMNANNKLFQNYKDTYIDDARSDPIWSYDDRKDYEDAKSTNADPYGMGTSTATREKIYGMASNVKNMAQYESMMRKLPTSLQDPFTQDVIAANSNKEGSGFANNVSKIYYAYKAVQGSPWGAYKTLYNVMQRGQGNAINPALAEGLPHVEDATNHWGRESDNAYKQWQDRNGGPRFSRVNPPPLALPAPPLRGSPTAPPITPGIVERPMQSGVMQESPTSGTGMPAKNWYNNEPNEQYDAATKTLSDIANGRARGGHVLTPAQIREINIKAKRTRMGRKIA